MPRVLLAHHIDDHYRPLLRTAIEQLGTDPRIQVQVEELWLYEYRASMAHGIDDCDYFIPVFSRRASGWGETSIWAIYAKHFRSRVETIVPITFDRSYSPWEFHGLKPLQIDSTAGLEELRRIVATPRSDVLAHFSGVLTTTAGIVEVAADAGRKLIRYFSCNPDQLHKIDRRDFEHLVANIFREFGYETEVTARTRDGGRDIIAIRRAEVDVKYLIECKRPDPGGYVSVNAVRELLGVKQDERATKGILATTARLSHDAKLFVERNWWELESREYDDLVAWLKTVAATHRGA